MSKVHLTQREYARLMRALNQAERMAWEVGSETEDGIKTICRDSRGYLWRELGAIIEMLEAT